MTQQLAYQDPRLWSALISIDGIGPAIHRQIMAEVKIHSLSTEEAWDSLTRLKSVRSRTGLVESVQQFQKAYAVAEYWEYLLEQSIQVVTDFDSRYPSLLRQVNDRPPVLFIQGRVGTWEQLPVAVVGTRRATQYGRFATEKLVGELVGFGSTIISGFMYGIDLEAHKAAVRNGGQTVGVLGFGFKHMYPSSQKGLFYEWLEAGQTFVTEFPPHTKPSKGTFPCRNRIVAGLSRAVIIVEAAAKSGSLITASLALEYGREVLAVPGPLYSVYSQGSIELINQGAQLVTSGKQVLEALGEHPRLIPRVAGDLVQPSGLDQLQHCIYTHLQQEPQNEEQLQAKIPSSMNQVLTALSMMEVAGWLKKTGDVWVVNV